MLSGLLGALHSYIEEIQIMYSIVIMPLPIRYTVYKKHCKYFIQMLVAVK